MKSAMVREPSCRAASSSQRFSATVRRMFTCWSRTWSDAGLGGLCPRSIIAATVIVKAETVRSAHSCSELARTRTLGSSTDEPWKAPLGVCSTTRRYLRATAWAASRSSAENWLSGESLLLMMLIFADGLGSRSDRGCASATSVGGCRNGHQEATLHHRGNGHCQGDNRAVPALLSRVRSYENAWQLHG